MTMTDYHEYSIGIEWNLTYKCNLNCIHCSVASYRDEDFIKKVYNLGKQTNIRELRYNELTTFFEILEKSLNHRIRIVFSPTNGESTLHPDFVDIWNTLSGINNVTSLWITTNGTILWKYLDKIDLTKLKRITFSIDGGTREVHEKIRGKGSFNPLWKSIEIVDSLKHDDPSFYLQVNYVINGLNANSLEKLPHLLKYLKSKVIINVFPVDVSFGNANINQELLNISYNEVVKNFAKMYTELREVNHERSKENLPPIRVNIHEISSRLFLLFKHLGTISFKDFAFSIENAWKSCAAYRRKRIHLDPYGNLYPCGLFTDTRVQRIFYRENNYYVVPNIMDRFTTIDNILNSEFFVRAKEWIDKLYKQIPCKTCSLRNSCPFCPISTYIWGIKDECSKI